MLEINGKKYETLEELKSLIKSIDIDIETAKKIVSYFIPIKTKSIVIRINDLTRKIFYTNYETEIVKFIYLDSPSSAHLMKLGLKDFQSNNEIIFSFWFDENTNYDISPYKNVEAYIRIKGAKKNSKISISEKTSLEYIQKKLVGIYHSMMKKREGV